MMVYESWQIFYSITNAVRLASLKEAVSNNQYHWQCSIYLFGENWEELFFLSKCTCNLYLAGLGIQPGCQTGSLPSPAPPLAGFYRLFCGKSTSIPKLPSHLGASRAQDRGNWTFVFLHSSLMWASPHRCKLLLRVIHRTPPGPRDQACSK